MPQDGENAEVAAVAEQQTTEKTPSSVPWSVKKQTILREYTTTGSIKVTAVRRAE